MDETTEDYLFTRKIASCSSWICGKNLVLEREILSFLD